MNKQIHTTLLGLIALVVSTGLVLVETLCNQLTAALAKAPPAEPQYMGCVIAVVISGTVAYLLREQHRWLCGVAEIAFAVCLTVFTVTTVHGIGAVFGLVGAVFVVLRGVDNIAKWIKDNEVNS